MITKSSNENGIQCPTFSDMGKIHILDEQQKLNKTTAAVNNFLKKTSDGFKGAECNLFFIEII